MAREGSGARGRIGDHYHPDIHPVGNFSELAANGNQQDLQPKSKAAGRSISRELNSFEIWRAPCAHQVAVEQRAKHGWPLAQKLWSSKPAIIMHIEMRQFLQSLNQITTDSLDNDRAKSVDCHRETWNHLYRRSVWCLLKYVHPCVHEDKRNTRSKWNTPTSVICMDVTNTANKLCFIANHDPNDK